MGCAISTTPTATTKDVDMNSTPVLTCLHDEKNNQHNQRNPNNSNNNNNKNKKNRCCLPSSPTHYLSLQHKLRVMEIREKMKSDPKSFGLLVINAEGEDELHRWSEDNEEEEEENEQTRNHPRTLDKSFEDILLRLMKT
eukprot:PhF_6_TR37708/c0_g1_i1/m.56134